MKLKLTSIVLCAAILISALSGCSKKDAVGTPDGDKATTTGNGGAKGRYVETAIDLPPDDSYPILISEREDGSVDYYGRSKEGDDFVAYNSKDLAAWDEQKLTWLDSIKASENGFKFVNYISKAKDGSLLVTIRDSKNAYRIYRVSNDIATEIPMPTWDLEAKNEDGMAGFAPADSLDGTDEKKAPPTVRETIYMSQITALDDGNFIICQPYTGMILYDGKTGAELKNYGESTYEIAVLKNKIYRLNQDHTGIETIDIETGNIEKLPVSIDNSQSVELFAGNDDAIYIASASGINRMVSGGSVLETIIDGGLSALSIPSLNLQSIATGKDRSFYMVFDRGDRQPTLYKAVFDPNASTVPDTEITVYSLYDNNTIRQAIGEFQQANPTIMVNYSVGIEEESSATVSDVIRALNTEILADKAPDILILDNLPAQSYIDKGVLADITDFYAELSKDNKFIEPVASSFKKDGKYFAIPARFKMPILMGESELLSKLNKLSDFNSDYDSKNPLMTTGEISEFLNAIIPSSYGAWIKEDKTLDIDKLTEFLTDINSIYGKYKPVVDSSGMMASTLSMAISGAGGPISFMARDMDFMTGKLQASINNAANGGFIAAMLKGMSFGVANGVAPEPRAKSSIKLAPGQTEGSYTPTVVAGITKNSKKQDIAKSFLKTLLSESVQNCAFEDGFAVNEKSFDFNNKAEISQKGETPKELVEVKALLSQLKTPVIIDSVVLDAVKTSATAMLNGEKDVATAVKDIQSKVEIYLAE